MTTRELPQPHANRKSFHDLADAFTHLPWWLQCLSVWAAALLVLTVLGLAVLRYIDVRGHPSFITLNWRSIPGLWVRWDSGYYLRLSMQGYAENQDALGFFPLYPLFMAGLSRISGLSLPWSGMIISQVSYLAAILVFYKLARGIRDDHAFAMRCVLFLVLFPPSFFYFTVYAESLALLFSFIGLFFILKPKPNYLAGGAAICLAALARPTGWMLMIVLLVEFIQRRRFSFSSIATLFGSLAISSAGITAFVVYLYSLTGSFLAIPRAQALWKRTWGFPWMTLWKSIRIVFIGNGVENDWFLYVNNLVDLSFALFGLAMAVVAIHLSIQKRFHWSLTLFMAASYVFLLSTQGVEVVPLWGMTRWVGTLLPIYLLLAETRWRPWAYWSFTGLSGVMMLFLGVWWMGGRWVG
jgi:hypothetical protein